MLKTTYEGETFPHRLLWEIVTEQAAMAAEREREWSKPALVAMVFAFHTVEAYLNFAGERLDPKLWQNEQEFFRKEPYRGWNGKLRKIMELVNLTWPEQAERPLKTILELKDLRDSIAHAKPEKLSGEISHADDTDPPIVLSSLHRMFAPKEKMINAVYDVERFVREIHSLAAPKVDDVFFGVDPLQGLKQYSLQSTSISK
jgi:hypothetical protein